MAELPGRLHSLTSSPSSPLTEALLVLRDAGKRVLLLRQTWVQFPAPMMGGLQPPETLAAEDGTSSSSLHGNCTQMYKPT